MRKKIATKLASVFIASVLLTSCAGDKSEKVTSLQKKDKNLSCDEVMLEINEAEFYRKTAEKNKAPKIKSVLMPLGYVSTYMDAEEASDAADARIDYLNRIYEILKCDEPAIHKEKVAKGLIPRGEYIQSASNGVNGANNVKYALVPVASLQSGNSAYDETYW